MPIEPNNCRIYFMGIWFHGDSQSSFSTLLTKNTNKYWEKPCGGFDVTPKDSHIHLHLKKQDRGFLEIYCFVTQYYRKWSIKTLSLIKTISRKHISLHRANLVNMLTTLSQRLRDKPQLLSVSVCVKDTDVHSAGKILIYENYLVYA